jgi:tRNA modification GTPase
MDLDGLPVTFLDTAGVRETEDEIERLGIERALDRARLADLRIYLLGGEADVRYALPPVPQDLVIYGKSDLGAPRECMAVSGRSGEGVAELLSSVSTILNRRVSTPATFIRQRHRDASVRARTSLTLALEELLIGRVELAAECIREAVLALDGLIGRVDVETLLGEIFSSFCIGK